MLVVVVFVDWIGVIDEYYFVCCFLMDDVCYFGEFGGGVGVDCCVVEIEEYVVGKIEVDVIVVLFGVEFDE